MYSLDWNDHHPLLTKAASLLTTRQQSIPNCIQTQQHAKVQKCAPGTRLHQSTRRKGLRGKYLHLNLFPIFDLSLILKSSF
jgi:hypothetical protein